MCFSLVAEAVHEQISCHIISAALLSWNTCFAWSLDGRFLSLGDSKSLDVMRNELNVPSRIRVFDSTTWTNVATLTAPAGSITCLAWSPDGKRLVAGHEDSTLTLWSTENWQPVLTLRGHKASVDSVA